MALDPSATENRNVFNMTSYHDNSGGARPKDIKQQENIQKRCNSAANARIKAQEVADRLRQKYCHDDKETDGQSNVTGEKVSRLEFAFGIPTMCSPLKPNRNQEHEFSLSGPLAQASKHKACRLKCHTKRLLNTENGLKTMIQKGVTCSPSLGGPDFRLSSVGSNSTLLIDAEANKSNSKLTSQQNEIGHVKLDRLRSKYDKWKKRDCTPPLPFSSHEQKVNRYDTLTRSPQIANKDISCVGDSVQRDKTPDTSNLNCVYSTPSFSFSNLVCGLNSMDSRTRDFSNNLIETSGIGEAAESRISNTYNLENPRILSDIENNTWKHSVPRDLIEFSTGTATDFRISHPMNDSVDYTVFPVDKSSSDCRLLSTVESSVRDRKSYPSNILPFHCGKEYDPTNNSGEFNQSKLDSILCCDVSNTTKAKSRIGEAAKSRTSDLSALENPRIYGSDSRECLFEGDGESQIFNNRKHCRNSNVMENFGQKCSEICGYSQDTGEDYRKPCVQDCSATNSLENLISFEFDTLAPGSLCESRSTNEANRSRVFPGDSDNLNNANILRLYDSKFCNSESSGKRMAEAVVPMTGSGTALNVGGYDSGKSAIRNVHEKRNYCIICREEIASDCLLQLLELKNVCDHCRAKHCNRSCCAANEGGLENPGFYGPVSQNNCIVERLNGVPITEISSKMEQIDNASKFISSDPQLAGSNLLPEQKSDDFSKKVRENSGLENSEDFFPTEESNNVLLTDESCSAALELSVLSLTSSTSDAGLADQSSITETSDSPIDAKMTRLEPINAASVISTSSKVCHCLVPKILNTSSCFSGCSCCHEWCMTCGLPMTLCSQCASARQRHLPNRSSQKKKSSESLSQLKQSSSDSEPTREMGQSSLSLRSMNLPTSLKPKRKRLSSSKDRDLAIVFPEIELRLCSAEKKMDSLIASLQDIPGLIGDPDSELFNDYLSLSIPPEYSWETREDNSSALDDLSADIESQDLVSDSSTLHYPLSDTECDDVSFAEELSEESGDADDEFECDCEHCLRFPLDTGEMTLASLSSELPLNYGSTDGEDLPDLDLDLNIDHLDPLDIILRNVNSRREVLEVMFESVILRMLLMRPDLLSDQAPPPASDFAITSLQKVTVNQIHIEDELSCAICLGRCELGDQLSSLPCHHLFHPLCVGAWLVKSGTCPVCRRSL